MPRRIIKNAVAEGLGQQFLRDECVEIPERASEILPQPAPVWDDDEDADDPFVRWVNKITPEPSEEEQARLDEYAAIGEQFGKKFAEIDADSTPSAAEREAKFEKVSNQIFDRLYDMDRTPWQRFVNFLKFWK